MPAKKPARKPAKKMPPPRVSVLSEDKLTPAQRALLDSIRSGPRETWIFLAMGPRTRRQ